MQDYTAALSAGCFGGLRIGVLTEGFGTAGVRRRVVDYGRYGRRANQTDGRAGRRGCDDVSVPWHANANGSCLGG